MLLRVGSLVSLALCASVLVYAEYARATDHVVIILGSAYFPASVPVRAGDRVRFVNESGEKHLVTSTSGSWSLGPMEDGDERVLKITARHVGRFSGKAQTEISGAFLRARVP
ncbi:MAG: hypothetical protein AAF636_16540 [Pseudomonadota bacterium]